jgi:2-polyprenyl-3-methyl-5-hydroxy-6-metoxy-1,4-benzoquinol methylase
MNCKICDSASLQVFEHTAKCRECGVLLFYPYPTQLQLEKGEFNNAWSESWYKDAAWLNHINFTQMLRFAIGKPISANNVNVLDFGGGGGQFALVCKSSVINSTIYIVDFADSALLDAFRPLNRQIKHLDFEQDETRFDYIFLNDVFEHVSDPLGVLKILSGKLNENGKIFIDTPKQFWLYPILKFVSKDLYTKLLRGTVSTNHLQIWTKDSFEFVVHKSGLLIDKYEEISEYTMQPEFYMKNMNITNPAIYLAGKLFYRGAKYIAKNKIICLLSKNDTL